MKTEDVVGLLNLFPTLIFNIQRVIQYSTSHSTFNYSFYIQFLFRPFNNLFNNFNQLFNFKTFNYSFNIQPDSLLVKNVAAARMPATKIEAYEDDTRLHFDVESGPPRFLGSVLQRTEQISQTKVDEEIVEQHIVFVDQTVRLLRIPPVSYTHLTLPTNREV